MVADLHHRHFATHRLDHARRFVAGNAGQRMRIRAVDEMQIASAHPARDGADQHLVRGGLVDGDVLDRERRLGVEEDGGFHVSYLI